MLVIDASAMAEFILGRASAARIETHLAHHNYELHVPHLLDLEVLSALRGLTAGGRTSQDRAAQALIDLAELPLVRHPHDALLPRIWELRSNFSVYDAAYLALAEGLADDGAPLLTADDGLARAARRHTDVEVLVPA